MAGGFEVVEELRFVNLGQGSNGLQLDYDLVIHEKVGTKVAGEDAFVLHGQPGLTLVWDAAQLELVGQGLIVDRLEKAGAEKAMHFHGRADDGVGQVFVEEGVNHGLR